MKKLFFIPILFTLACNSSNPLTNPTGSNSFTLYQRTDSIETVDRRLPPFNSPNSCPQDAPLVLAQTNYNHLDIEWNQNPRANQVWINIKRLGVTNRAEQYKLVRELIEKGKIEIPVLLPSIYYVEVAFELTACGTLSNKTSFTIGGQGPSNDPVNPTLN